MTCNRRSLPISRDKCPVEVNEIPMWEVYDPATARVIATFECKVDAEAYAATVNGRTPQPDTSERCCQNG